MQRFFGVSQDTSGNAIPSVTVRVNLAGTVTAATIYSDNLYTPKANPFTSNTDGTYQFYARDGRYDVILTKTGFTFTNSETADIRLEDFASVISPAQITANQNDYTPTNGLNALVWRLSSDATRTITGIGAGNSGQAIVIENVGSFTIAFSNQDANSAAANQIITGTGGTLNIAANGALTLRYDATTLRWRVISAAQGTNVSEVTMTPGTITGLTLTNDAGDLTNDIGIAVGAASSDDAVLLNRESMSLTSAYVKQLDVNWSVGTAAGMLDTGIVGNNTYHIFLIKDSTGVVDVLASLSPTAPTMPAGYTKKRRIGSIYRTGGANVRFHQFGDEFWLDTPVADFNGLVAATTVQTLTLSIPTGVSFIAMTNWMSNGNQIVYVKPTTAVDAAPSTAGAPGVTVGAAAGPLTENAYRVPTDTSAQINYRSNSTVVTLTEITHGWRDHTRVF